MVAILQKLLGHPGLTQRDTTVARADPHNCKPLLRRPGGVAAGGLAVAVGPRPRDINRRAYALEAAESLREASPLVDWESIAAAILETSADSGRVL